MCACSRRALHHMRVRSARGLSNSFDECNSKEQLFLSTRKKIPCAKFPRCQKSRGGRRAVAGRRRRRGAGYVKASAERSAGCRVPGAGPGAPPDHLASNSPAERYRPIASASACPQRRPPNAPDRIGGPRCVCKTHCLILTQCHPVTPHFYTFY